MPSMPRKVVIIREQLVEIKSVVLGPTVEQIYNTQIPHVFYGLHSDVARRQKETNGLRMGRGSRKLYAVALSDNHKNQSDKVQDAVLARGGSARTS